ncbi:heme biosynthesis protein HemY [Limnohabitans sp. DCL3]|uniref:heme biosynthesis protein HemY n=1 Tax=Limnohabitans sp. DCL3 TaxID=3374103 RepID=UPI003A84AE7B
MRAALWLISLFALAAAAAWLAGNNQGTVTLFLSPYRIDLSLNLVLLMLGLVVLVVVLAQQALSALLSLPQQAQRWRLQQKERAAHAAMLESISQFMAGRYLRARKSAQLALEKEALLTEAGLDLDHAVVLRTLAHTMAAESAHALQDRDVRQTHWDAALQAAKAAPSSESRTLSEGIQLRAARWLLDDRDAPASLALLQSLPSATARRMVAMRLQLKAARLAGQPAKALDTAVLLAKHRAFTPAAGDSLVRSLILAWLSHAHDADAVQRLWLKLSAAQRSMPDLAAEAALRWMSLGGEGAVARTWLQAVWEPLQSPKSKAWTPEQLARMVQALEAALADAQASDARAWLARVEAAQLARPQDPLWQYLTGTLCLRHQLWGKAQGLLSQSVKGLQTPTLKRQAWCALAELAEQRQDLPAATAAWKQAAKLPRS